MVTVNEIGVPMAAPLALTKEIVPVQDAAVPLEDVAAVFTTFSCAVSELLSPIGGEVRDRVVVVDVVCANAAAAVSAAIPTMVDRNRLTSMLTFLGDLMMKAAAPNGAPASSCVSGRG